MNRIAACKGPDPEQLTLTRLLAHRAESFPDRTSYTYLSSDGAVAGVMTYAELYSRARRMAGQLRDLAGDRERFLLLYPSGLEYITAFFGTLFAGAIPIPAYPPTRSRNVIRLESIIRDATPAAVLTTPDLLPRLKYLTRGNACFEKVLWQAVELDDQVESAPEYEAPSQSEQLAFLQYTSGSTGTPKGVMLTHRNLLHNAECVYQACRHNADDRYVSWLPPFHDMGFMAGLLQPLYGGFPAYLMAPFTFLNDPFRWLEAISRFKATTSGGPNFSFGLCTEKVAEAQLEGIDLRYWRIAFNGADTVRMSTMRSFAEKFARCEFRFSAFLPCYGLAEATLMVSAKVAGRGPETFIADAQELEKGIVVPSSNDTHKSIEYVSNGVAAGEQNVLIVDPETLEPCPPGKVGEIWVSGPSVAAGYWRRPEDTRLTFQVKIADDEGTTYLRTGDLGFFQCGELFIAGRRKDLLIIRGRNLHPQDIEQCVDDSYVEGARGSCAAFSVEIDGQEQLVICKEASHHSTADHKGMVQAIVAAVSEQLDVLPFAICLVHFGEIPRTSSGKVQRSECRKRFLQKKLRSVHEWHNPSQLILSSQSSDTDGARSLSHRIKISLTKLLAELETFTETDIDPEQPIVAFGMDSLRAIQVAHELEKMIGVKITAGDLLDGSSISMIAQRFANVEQIAARIPPVGPSPSPADSLSVNQKSLWFLHKKNPNSSAYSIVRAARIYGPIDVNALHQAFEILFSRHLSLRTRFREVNGIPVQFVLERAEFSFEVVERPQLEEELLESIRAFSRKPFDLETGELARIRIFSTRAEPILVISFHHIIVDFWSFAILAEELEEIYRSLRTGVPARLAAPCQYSDFVAWQSRALQSGELEHLGRHWERQLSGPFPAPLFASDRRSESGTGAALFSCGEALTAAAKRLARSHEATLYSVLLAAYQILLHRITGREDFAVGLIASGRQQPKFARTVGYFVNPVVARCAPSADIDCSSFIKSTQKAVLETFQTEAFPFAELIRRMQLGQRDDRNPLFQVAFGFYGDGLFKGGGRITLCIEP